MTATAKKREEQRREKAAAMRREAEAKARKRRATTIAVSVLGVLVLIVGLTIGIRSATNDSGGITAAPAGATSAGGSAGFVVGQASAPVTVDVYEDFQCPACKSLEDSTGATIDKLNDEGKVKLRYHMLSFIDDNSGGTYSKRSANAAACVQQYQPSDWRAFHNILYKNQKAEGTGGLTNPQILDLAKQVGVTDADVTTCVNNDTYKKWVAKVQDDASKFGVNQTPTLYLNGKAMASTDLTADGFTKAVAAATPKTSASPSPSASK